MRTWEQLVSIAALSVIVSGAAYAYNREHAESNLQRWYDEDNQRYFAGKLPSAWIHFGDLTKDEADGEARFSRDAGSKLSWTVPVRTSEALSGMKCATSPCGARRNTVQSGPVAWKDFHSRPDNSSAFPYTKTKAARFMRRSGTLVAQTDRAL